MCQEPDLSREPPIGPHGPATPVSRCILIGAAKGRGEWSRYSEGQGPASPRTRLRSGGLGRKGEGPYENRYVESRTAPRSSVPKGGGADFLVNRTPGDPLFACSKRLSSVNSVLLSAHHGLYIAPRVRSVSLRESRSI